MARPALLSVPDAGYSWPELRDLLRPTLDAGISALVLGHPGVGKSALAQDLAAHFGLPLVDIRLAQQDPADLGGVYMPDAGRTTMRLLPPQWVREVCAEPSFVFLDEVNAAVTRLHQAVAYQIVLEHRVGPFRFHPDTVVLAAGNLQEDEALATGLSSALGNRFAHFQLRVDAPVWLQWATAEGIDPRILAYVELHGRRVLYDRRSGEVAFASPRSWAMASRLLKRVPDTHARQAVAACVGRRAAEQFAQFLKLYGRLKPDRIVLQGRMPRFTGANAEPSRVHATVVAVADWACAHANAIPDDRLANLVRFLRVDGLDQELWFLFLRRLARASDLVDRLKALRVFRELAGELVGLHAELYR